MDCNGCGSLSLDEGLKKFGITTEGIDGAGKYRLLKSANLSGKKIAETINTSTDGAEEISSQDAFRQTHGELTIVVDPNADTGGSGNCKTESGTITCKQSPNLQNIIHEFGHAFDAFFEQRTGNLASDSIPDWTDRSPDYFGKEYGYACDYRDTTCLAHSWYTYASGYELKEQFADVYMNWVLDGLGYGNGFNEETYYWLGAEQVTRGEYFTFRMTSDWLP